MKADLFVGVIKWNSEFLLEHCLRLQLRGTVSFHG
jgi:hypothetical protein